MKTQITKQQANVVAVQQTTLSPRFSRASSAKSLFLMGLLMLASLGVATAQTPSVVPSYCIPNTRCYYYLAFVSGCYDPNGHTLPTIDATSSNILSYNNFVNTAAAALQGYNPSLNTDIDASALSLTGGVWGASPTWYALASTPTVNAITNIAPLSFTYPVLNVHSGGPNIVSLSPKNWLTQTLLDPNIGMNIDKFGEFNRSNCGAWTGTNNTDGTSSGAYALGGCTGNCGATWSNIVAATSDWIDSGTDNISAQKEMYAISGLLCADSAAGQAQQYGACSKCIAPPPNMVAWYSFDQTGSSQSDLTTYHNTATAFGTTSIAGEVSNALQFDGTDDYVQAPNAPQLNLGTGNLSIDVWAKLSSAPSGVVSLVDKRQSSPLKGYQLFLYNYTGSGPSQLGLQLADGVGIGYTNYVSTAAVPADSKWHLLAVTVVRNLPTGGTFYVDGVARGTFNPTARVGSLNSGATLDIGVQQGGGESFKGGLDELEIFNRALGLIEVQSLYLAGAHGKCK